MHQVLGLREAIFEGGISQVLKKHVFTAMLMLAQHVASELRMHLWPSRSLTDRNTPSRLKIDLVQSGYNGFLSYNGYMSARSSLCAIVMTS